MKKLIFVLLSTFLFTACDDESDLERYCTAETDCMLGQFGISVNGGIKNEAAKGCAKGINDVLDEYKECQEIFEVLINCFTDNIDAKQGICSASLIETGCQDEYKAYRVCTGNDDELDAILSGNNVGTPGDSGSEDDG